MQRWLTFSPPFVTGQWLREAMESSALKGSSSSRTSLKHYLSQMVWGQIAEEEGHHPAILTEYIIQPSTWFGLRDLGALKARDLLIRRFSAPASRRRGWRTPRTSPGRGRRASGVPRSLSRTLSAASC